MSRVFGPGPRTLICDGRAVAPVAVADTAWTRGRGLLGTRGIEGALWLSRTRSIVARDVCTWAAAVSAAVFAASCSEAGNKPCWNSACARAYWRSASAARASARARSAVATLIASPAARSSADSAATCSPALVASLSAQEKRGRTFVDSLEQPVVGDPQLSPDGKQIAFIIDRADWKQNRRVSHVFRINVDGTNQVQLTFGDRGEGSPRWSPDGKWLAFTTRREPDQKLGPTPGCVDRAVSDRDSGRLRDGTTFDNVPSARIRPPPW
mgnify:CR=1 FL=1